MNVRPRGKERWGHVVTRDMHNDREQDGMVGEHHPKSLNCTNRGTVRSTTCHGVYIQVSSFNLHVERAGWHSG